MLPYMVEENYHYKYQGLAFTIITMAKLTNAWISYLLSAFLTQEYRGHNRYTYKFIVVPEAGVQMKGFVLGEINDKSGKVNFFFTFIYLVGGKSPQCTCKVKGQLSRVSSPSTLWVLGIELRYHQPWQQVPLSSEPSCQPLALTL